MVRAAAKNHANVAIVTSPARYDAVLAALDGDGDGLDDGLRAALARRGVRATPPPTTPGSPRRCRRGWPRPASPLPDEPGLPGADDPYPPSLTIALEKVETLRYGENPHQPAARYRRPGSDRGRRPVRDRRAAAPGQGAVVQQRPRRVGRGGARPGAARPGVRHRQAHEPVRRRRAGDARSRRGRPRSRAIRSRRSVGSWR